MPQALTIRELLARRDTLPEGHWVFIPAERALQDMTVCLIVEPELLEDVDRPAQAAALGPCDELQTDDVIDIIENARAQKPHAGSSELWQALEFYLAHDAFIDFDRVQHSGVKRG